MNHKGNFFVLFADCIPVKGHGRSVICDLRNNQLKLIPNDLFVILTKFENYSIEEIKKNFEEQFTGVIDDYFDFLFENNFGHYTNSPESFPRLNLQWHTYQTITNAILDIGLESKHDFQEVFKQLEILECKHVQIRFFCNSSIYEISQIVDILKKNDSSIISIDFVLPANDGFTIESINGLILDHPRITSFIVYNSKVDIHIEPIRDSLNYFIFTKENVDSYKSCGMINSSYFSVNVKNFTESQKHNSCLNQKISIDIRGNIKNCPSMSKSFGNIKDISLPKTLKYPDFKKYWHITKDQIETCKDCEFRYVCTDCRAFTERTKINNDIDFSKPLKCGYNPYTNEWEEWSANPLKQNAIEYYGIEDLVKKE